MRRRALLLAVSVGTLACVQTAASALWADGSSGAMPYSSASLAPATNPATAAGTCVIAVSDRIAVSWTASASTWATGYEIMRATSSGGPYSLVGTTLTPIVTFTDGPLAFSTTYFYEVRAIKGSWRSSYTAPVSRATRNALCL